jgi:hypothetical protein
MIPLLKKLFVIPFVFSSVVLLAQNGSTVYNFLNTPVSARQAALGGNAISISDYDPAFAATNPSLMNKEMSNKISLSAALYLADSKYGTVSYVRDLDNGHLLNIHARYMDYGKLVRADEAGFVMGDFSASDVAIGAGYAYQFEDNWTIGGNLNFITSKIDAYSSMAVSANAGVTYHVDKTGESASIVFRNFGYQFKPFNGVRENLPLAVDLGYTRRMTNFPMAFTITAHDLQAFNISSNYSIDGHEVGFIRKVLDHFSVGAELFPEKNFNLRLGYNVKRGNELAVLDQRSFSGISAGIGIKFGAFRFDYTHARYHNASNLNQIGILYDLTGNKY